MMGVGVHRAVAFALFLRLLTLCSIGEESAAFLPRVENSRLSTVRSGKKSSSLASLRPPGVNAGQSATLKPHRSSFVALPMTHVNAIVQNELEGRTVLLTGASGGLGRAFAIHLARCGVKTLILSARRLDAIEKVAESCREVNPSVKIHSLTCDLSDPESVAALAKSALTVCPSIDVLVNNGGVSSRSRFLDTSPDIDQRVMQINFLSGAYLAKAVVPGMVANGYGRIIWISSVQGLVGIPNRSSYAASKFAVQGYCESIRSELASSGVSVHCASPGYIRTNLSTSALTGDGSAYGKLDPTTAAGADPDDVAATILNKVARGEADFVVAATTSATAAIWLRLLCPRLLRYSLVKRYEKSQKEKVD